MTERNGTGSLRKKNTDSECRGRPALERNPEIWIRSAEIRQAREMEEQENQPSVYWKSVPIEEQRIAQPRPVWDDWEKRWILP